MNDTTQTWCLAWHHGTNATKVERLEAHLSRARVAYTLNAPTGWSLLATGKRDEMLRVQAHTAGTLAGRALEADA